MDAPFNKQENRVAELEHEAARLCWIADAFWNAPTEKLAERGSRLFEQDSLSANETIQEARVEYTRLVCSCSEGSPYPYESVYSDESRLLMRPVRDNVLAVYRANEFEPDQGEGFEPEDHVSTELRFIAFLMREEAEFLSKGETDRAKEAGATRATFKQEHFSTWVPLFCSEIFKQKPTGFMLKATELLKKSAE